MLPLTLRRRARTLAPVFIAALFAGCASEPPVIPQGPGVETSYDGLVRVLNSRADEAWARQDIDLSSYDKIILQNAGIQYRPVKAAPRSIVARAGRSEFPVSEEGRRWLSRTVDEIFFTELAKSERFEVVTEPGEDVLLIRGELLDVVSYVPPEPIGRADIYLDSVGEVTLVLEIRDSMSGAILARAIDRRAAQRVGGELQESNRVTNTTEVRRLIQYWARLLRSRLDEATR